MAEKYQFKQLSNTTDETVYEVSVGHELFDEYKEKTFKELSSEVKIPGFRPGKAPRDLIEVKLGSKLVTETLGKILPQVAYEVVVKEDLNPITQLDYKVTDIKEDGSIVFTFSFTSYPKVKLGDLAKVKATKKVKEVTDSDVELVIRNMIMSSLPEEKWKKNTPEASEENTSKKKTAAKTTTKASSKKAEKKESAETLFEITDELVSELKFEEVKTVAEMKKTVKKKLEEIKSQEAEDDYISEIIKNLIEISEVPVPAVFLEKETKRIEDSFLNRLTQINLEAEVYLQTQGTTLEKKREEWKKDALNSIQNELVLLQLALDQKVMPTDEEVENQINSIQDAATRESYANDEGRRYVRSILTKQKSVKKLLELVEGKPENKSKK
jgi:trigger factor